jgi:acyl-CoA dehydrogenase
VAIDFTLSPEIEALRNRVRTFVDEKVRPDEARLAHRDEMDSEEVRSILVGMRRDAKKEGLWLPQMPPEWGGMGLGHLELATVQAEAGRSYYAPWVLNCMAPDEGNMHTLLGWCTDEQKERYLRPLCEGKVMSCFAMTEPEVAGSDPTLMQTRAVPHEGGWLINGHKWFISNARRASFAILLARTDEDPDVRQSATTAFLVDIPSDGWNRVREIETMHGPSGHSEIVIEDLFVPDENVLGPIGQGHRIGQFRLGPARLAHCMRWIAQAEVALDMMVERSISRYSHGSTLSEKQGVQWMIAESTIEIYQAKLMVMHTAYRIDQKLEFRGEVSMTKHFVANALNRIIDRAIQVHGALGYSKDTPLADMSQHARMARLVDGADEIHLMRTAQRAIEAFKADGTTRAATGDLPV